MRWRSGLMGFSSIAKTPVSHGVEPHDLETVRTFAFVFSSLKLSASHRRNYRASGFVPTSIPAGRSVTSHVETLAAETSGLTRPLILERGSIVFRRRLMPWEWRRLACACQRCQGRAPQLSCRPPLPTFFQKFQTAAIHKTSSLWIAVLHTWEGTARGAWLWFWPWISFPSRRSSIQSWRQSHMTVHKRIRRFNTRDTYPEQKLDNDLCQTVVAEGTMVFVRGQVGQDLDSSESVAIGDAVGQAEKAMANIEVLLKEAGSQLEHVCKITIYIVDPRYREGVYRVVGKWLKGVFPVSTGIVVSGLARPEWLVEIDAIAVIPDQGL